MNRFIVAASAVCLLGCNLAYKKKCFGNGVCRVESNGQVTWEGPPDEVAKMQGAEQGQKDAAAAQDSAYDTAPRRAANEPIRAVLVGPGTASPALAPLAATYRQMFEQALANDAQVQWVPYDSVSGLVEATSGDVSPLDRNKLRESVDEGLTRRLRDLNNTVDVVVVLTISEKKDSSIVAGGGGVGVAEFTNVDFAASYSSVFKFAEQHANAIGKSTSGVALAGIDKQGKKGSATLKGERNPEKDKAAIGSLSSTILTALKTQIGPTLPSIAASSELRKKGAEATVKQMPEFMQRLMQKKK